METDINNPDVVKVAPSPQPYKNRLKLIGILLFLAIGSGVAWAVVNLMDISTKKEEKSTPQNLPAGVETVINQKLLIDPAKYISQKKEIIANIPSYKLPLPTSQIVNYRELANKLPIDDTVVELIAKNGFAAMNTPKEILDKPEEFDNFYSILTAKEIPVFVTADSLLHYYHVFFDTSLLRLEKDIFYDDMWQMSKRFLDDQTNTFDQSKDPQVKEAARKNMAYLSVALSLLSPDNDQIVTKENVKQQVDCYGDPQYCKQTYDETIRNGTFSMFGQTEANKYQFEIPAIVETEVNQELELMNKAEGWKCSPIYLYEEDYSQYVPRGHYSRAEKLKNYFKAVMWYGRMVNLVQGSPNLPENKCSRPGYDYDGGTDWKGLVSVKDAQTQTLAALLLAKKFTSDSEIQRRWNRVYAITAFYVGYSDDLGPVEYSQLLSKINDKSESGLAKDIDVARDMIKKDLKKPKIYSGTGNVQMTVYFPPPLTQEQIDNLKKQAETLLANTQGFRMMGQREVVDSTIFSNIVSPYSGEYTGDKEKLPFTHVETRVKRQVRGFPRGLDIMALFGSDRALAILNELGDTKYSNFDLVYNQQKQLINALPETEWYKNLYWNWLYALKSLNQKYTTGYPTFMQTEAWQDKELATTLASWSELRHDTLLYVKQSYTMAEMGGGAPELPKVGYVEPVPEFYWRLLNLTKMTKEGLEKLLTKEEMDAVRVPDALNSFERLLNSLYRISQTELDNKELTKDDYTFIKYFGGQLKRINFELVGASRTDEIDPNMFKTTMVADVHTDGNTNAVLEEGVGYIKTILVAYKLPDGRILLGAGPMFSYYEFKQPMENRLTDEAWRNMLATSPPAEPEWVKSFSK